MTVQEVIEYLKSKGSEQTRKTFRNHGAPDNMFGVKVGDLKPIEKKERGNHQLALELFATGNADAQYLAGLIADPKMFSKEDFENWTKTAAWKMITDYAIGWNIAESPLCTEVCFDWINHSSPRYRATAWAALSAYLGIVPNEELNLEFHKGLVQRIEKEIHTEENHVKDKMNSYVIALGIAVPELTTFCKEAGNRIGMVEVNYGKTSCKTPAIFTYIEKAEKSGRIGRKKKKAKC